MKISARAHDTAQRVLSAEPPRRTVIMALVRRGGTPKVFAWYCHANRARSLRAV